MKKAIDPFEEFLRKKKVELLEQQYRDSKDRAPDAPADDVAFEEPPVVVAVSKNDDPVQEAKVAEEMSEFFESGQVAGAEAFESAKNLGEDKADEIKDALDGVFESDTPQPQTEEKSDTFVGFFKQVQDEFDDRNAASTTPYPDALPPAPPVDPTPGPEPEPAVLAEPLPVVEPLAVEEPVAELDDLDAVAYEVSSDAETEVVASSGRDDGRLSLAEILLKGEETSVETRVEALCRVVDKLVERGALPESELIEALIKAGVEF